MQYELASFIPSSSAGHIRQTGTIQPEQWERIYKEWLPVSDYELITDYDIENYLPGDPSSRDYVSEICISVRKSK